MINKEKDDLQTNEEKNNEIEEKVDKLNIILADAMYELRIINEKKYNLYNEVKKR